ncbi:DUF2380 domain-containing protein [Glaciimonas sp. PCH181]|uniref:DUF2380 domain-containing protein n=1 Tax=Glaciimonas sp. PCH181 TaxID=2133943 RepID=UPI000D33D561|nr:DUF2380 domain-containing protein [Glaciimonas sp. PCH181]PUA17679.1 DUF2380 domain-containing protein [Glaciimonas sp. PCH181]
MPSIFARFRNISLVIVLGLLPATHAFAEELSIAILDFELNDLTLNLTANPVNPEEVDRTASIKALLQKALEAKGGYKIIDIDLKTQEKANAAFGYLYDHNDVAAELGQSVGADWIVVGRIHKASFLFVYLKAQLINTKTKQLVEIYSVEIKGQQKKITPKGVNRLAQQISETLRPEIANSLR